MIILLIVSSSALAQIACDDGIVSYWTFDDADKNSSHYLDIYGNNHGEIVGSPTSVSGKIGNALEFVDDNADYIDIPHASNLDLTSGNYTIEIILNLSSGSGYALGKDDQSDGYGIYSSGSTTYGIITGDFGPSGSTSANNWHHVVVTYDNTGDDTMETWTDNVSGGTTSPNNPADSNSGIRIGRSYTSTSFAWGGQIDEIIIYNTKLSDETISSHYSQFNNNQGLCGFVNGGNATNVTASGLDNSLSVLIGGSEVVGDDRQFGSEIVQFKDGSNLVVNFTHDFDSANLALDDVSVTKDTNSIVVNFTNSGITSKKPLFLDDSSYATVCVANRAISSDTDISAACNGVNETKFSSAQCISGTSANGITCNYANSQFIVSNLSHSGIEGTAAVTSIPEWDDYALILILLTVIGGFFYIKDEN